MRWSVFLLGSCLSVLSLSACSDEKQIISTSNIKLGVSQGLPSSLVGPHMLLDNSQVLEKFMGFTGLPAVDWTIRVDGCLSEYSTVVNSTTTNPVETVPLFNLDEACQAGLERLGWQGKQYEKVGGGVLTGESGSNAKFQDPASGDTLVVVLETQLSSPITDASKAEFNFYTSDIGTGVRFGKGVDVRTNVAGIEPPNLEILNIDYPNLAGGVPTWEFKFECQAPVVNGACPTASGDQHPLELMSVRVVPDTFNNTPTYQAAEEVFATGDAGAAVPDATIGTRGGFLAQVKGTDKLWAQRNLMVFVRYKRGAGSSYRAYNFDLDPPR